MNRGAFADTDTVNSEASPCRLYVYPARGAAVAAVLRRGPSAWTRLSLWHTDTDEIEHGQWFAGRVYERRCDLSPDGRLFAYFARKDTAQAMADIGADSWIAVSRPPWFTALALWAIGSTWCAGAYFDNAGTLFAAHIESPPDKGKLAGWLALTKTPRFQDRTNDWTDRTVFFSRQLRDGWVAVPDASAVNPSWERPSPDGRWTLVMTPRQSASFNDYGGRSATHYLLRDSAGGTIRDLGEATWADWDGRGRLALARDGKLLAGDAAGELAVVADFNPQRPQAQAPPAIARSWP